jgi:hypothetical protein
VQCNKLPVYLIPARKCNEAVAIWHWDLWQCVCVDLIVGNHRGGGTIFFWGNEMKSFILLVTWIVSGQPPNSYQAAFTSAAACSAARDAVLAGQRLKAEADQVQINAAQALGQDPAIFLAGNRPPAVTAVCVAQ